MQQEDLINPTRLSELRRIELRSKRAIDSDLMGRYRSSFRGSGLMFSDLREYQPGDDVKKIHWPVTARTGKVYVKSYEEDREQRILIVLDISRSTEFGSIRTKHRRALEFSALLAMLAKLGQDQVGLCLFGAKVLEFIRPSRARSQVQRILRSLLSGPELSRSTDIAQALRYISQHQRRRSVVFLISDFLSPPFGDDLRALAFKHDVILVWLDDPLDHTLPNTGLTEFEDAESGARITVDLGNEKIRTKMAHSLKQRQSDTQELCRSLNIDFMVLADDPLKPLADLMARRKRRFR